MKNIKLIEARNKTGLTQVQVAKKAGITVVCYQRYEAGERIPRADIAILIAKAVNSSVEELFGPE
ncbi:MAG: helix-turn-helix transcriptional regulator [Oscillospiraceae bacterium]|jgi:DNA-binding XRE family transcriptional regulator